MRQLSSVLRNGDLPHLSGALATGGHTGAPIQGAILFLTDRDGRKARRGAIYYVHQIWDSSAHCWVTTLLRTKWIIGDVLRANGWRVVLHRHACSTTPRSYSTSLPSYSTVSLRKGLLCFQRARGQRLPSGPQRAFTLSFGIRRKTRHSCGLGCTMRITERL